MTTAPRRTTSWFVEHRFGWLAGWDSLGWVAALWLCTWARYEFSVSAMDVAGAVKATPLVIGCHLIAGFSQGLYRGRWQVGSFEEIAAVLRTALAAVVLFFVANLSLRWVPISVPVVAVFVAIVAMVASRYAWRRTIERRSRPKADGALSRVVVFGAGEGAVQVLTAMLRDPDSPLVPVAILDDDPRKAHLQIRGVRVRGNRYDVARVARELDADTLLIAIPSADGTLVREMADLGANAGLEVMAVPAVADLFDRRVGMEDIRPLTTADLLGRREIDTDLASIADYLTGRRVLITGAGGSIGSELCRQVHRLSPAELVLLDRDESGLHAVQLSIEGRALLDSRNLVVADIRDDDRLEEVFAEHRPEVVFHAAALKHLPLCELHPEEAVKTNVWGTSNLLRLALAYDVTTFVNISTDKAADPTSVLGATKRIAERLTSAAADKSDGDFISVRFGNVLGSRGSVLESFRAQIAKGGPVTVTHPEVTRYFMTVEEAVQLVIQAGAIGGKGEAMVLDMGQPVRITDVARRLIDQAGNGIEIVYTGLRDGEKLHEVLMGGGDQPRPSSHPLINVVEVEPIAEACLTGLSGTATTSLNVELRRFVSTPATNGSEPELVAEHHHGRAHGLRDHHGSANGTRGHHIGAGSAPAPEGTLNGPADVAPNNDDW